MSTNDTAPITALLKAFSIIEQLSEGKSSLADVARRIGVPKTSAFRLLATLVELGIADKDDTGDYSLTTRLFGIGARALGTETLVRKAIPFMQDLRDHTGETVHLAVRHDDRVVYLHKEESPHSLRMISRTGYQAPLFCTSLGKSLTAWLNDGTRNRLLEHMAFHPVMPNTIQDAATLAAHLEEVKRLGYSCDNEENEPGVICFGVPLFDHYTQVCAAVSVSMPMLRYSEEKRAQFIPALQKASALISKELGCTHPPLGDEEGEV